MDNRMKKRLKMIGMYVSILILIVIIGILKIKDNASKLQSYDPENSYIITENQIDRKVHNESEARKLLEKFELGNEYELTETFNLTNGIIYQFLEAYKGIEVHGRYSRVITNSNEDVEAIASNYYPVDIDILPEISEDEAIDVYKKYYDEKENSLNNISADLCIYGYSQDMRLSYCIREGNGGMYVDAKTNEVIQVFDNMDFAACVLTGNLGDNSVNVRENNGNYELIDDSRSGGIEACILTDEMNGVVDFDVQNCVRVIAPADNAEKYRFFVDGYFNVERAYDYYAKVHNFKSTDGNGKRKIRIINDVEAYITKEGKKEFRDNAASTPVNVQDGNVETWFLISKVNDSSDFLYSYYLDVMTHEYTHAVMFSIIGNDKSKQMEAMGEAYSDILGECCEAYYNTENDWIIGPRNIADVANGVNEDTSIRHMNEYSEDIEMHDASTIISSAAYNMFNGVDEKGEWNSKYAIHSTKVLEQLWFRSMFYLTPTSDFLTCRYAIENVAKAMNKEGIIDDLQFEGVKNAFEKVGVRGISIKENKEMLDVTPDFNIQIKDKFGNDYNQCNMKITCLYKGHNYKGHNVGITYRTEENNYLYEGAFLDYEPKKLKYEKGAIYCIRLKDYNNPLEDEFIFQVKAKGKKELILQTSFWGEVENSFESEENMDVEESNESEGAFVLENPYPEGYQMKKTAFDNLLSGHFTNLSEPMGLENGKTYDASKKFAVKATYDMEDPANGASYLVIADVMGNVYDMLPVSKYPCEVNGWLKNDVFYNTQKGRIVQQGSDITSNFFEDHTSLNDIVNDTNGIIFLTCKISFDSPYERKDSNVDFKYEVIDADGHVIVSFYRNELINKYGFKSMIDNDTYKLISLSGGVYCAVSRRDEATSGSGFIIIDVNRKKVFAVCISHAAEYEKIESDGNYILFPSEYTEDATILDIENETSIVVENVPNAECIGENKFFAGNDCYDLQGNIIFSDEESGKVVQRSAYHNGKSLVLIDMGENGQIDRHTYNLLLLDENGKRVSDVISINGSDLFFGYVEDLSVYCIFSKEGTGGFLFENGNFQNEETYETTNRADKNCYYGVVENDNRLILRYRTVGYDQSKVLHQDLLFECQLFKMN